MRFPVCIVAACLIGGCGGGGGGGGGSNDGAAATPLIYTGSTDPAVLTTANAALLASNLTGGASGSLSAGAASGAALDSLGLLDIGRTLQSALRRAPVTPAGVSSPTAAIPVDNTSACPAGGSTRVFGTLNDDATGTVSVTYNACSISGSALQGEATMRVDAYDLALQRVADATVSFTRMTMRGAINADLTGSFRMQLNVAGRSETLTENVVALYIGSGRMSRSENLVWTQVYADIVAQTSYVESIAGRLFDSQHGFVTLSTITPFVFSTTTQQFPHSGEVLLTGLAGSRASISALSATLARVAVDADGDGTYEASGRIAWISLGAAVGADLGDDDADGMHDSWESVHGLNPSSAADAGSDPDGDGQSNLAEYLAGTAPNVSNVAPPIAPAVLAIPGNTALVYDSVSQRVYAAVGSNPGSIVPINPASGTLGTPIPAGNNPSRLAISDDGQYFYVGLEGQGSVQRIQVASPHAVLDIPLGLQAPFGARYADDIAALPGAPQSFAVSMRYQGTSPRHAGVAIFDNAVARSLVTPGHTGANVIEFSAAATTLYGYNNETTGFGFYRMAVDASGVSVLDVHDSFHAQGPLISGFGSDMKFSAGLIFATTGAVVDPAARAVLGTMALPVPFGNLVVADATLNRAFYLTLNSGTWEIRAFDITTRALLGREALPGVSGTPGNLIRWGARGLAFRTSSGQVFLVESTTLIP